MEISTGSTTDRRRLWSALALLLGFMIAEVAVALFADSLALLADAAHMTTDASAVALALFAIWLAARPAAGSFTYGLRRAEILAAQANGITLLLLTIFFVVESIRRLINPPSVEGGLVLVVAIIGVAVNLIATTILRHANRASLNVEAAFRHVITDLYAFVGTAAAAVIVITTGFTRADAIASLFVAVLMAKAGWGLVRDSGRVFLEAAPKGIDPDVVEAELRALPGIVEVHDFHIWEVTSGFPALSAHILVQPECGCHERRAAVEQMLARRYFITHTTLQVDHWDTVKQSTASGRSCRGSIQYADQAT